MFDCLFCQTGKAVEVKMVRLEQIGFLKCRVCNVSFQSRISYLSEAVDVYSDWVDETEEANFRKDDDIPAGDLKAPGSVTAASSTK
eukprot:CAMPEP_0115398184 /NCGR_PEP_ID=MMETSP0271-20121206/14190_1 /TAXON_ID=71861 /ORGANISM="Scrippsiella trochoidea, Strain CCMP3099" /LENGTH=85 /DNA_ID=CAMNT_0002821957 /DNA_START=125 /DNA_END=382 /DNA_ORIENTATION=-